MTLSWFELLVLAAALGFLLFAFTRNGRTVANIMFGGLLFLMASGLFFAIFAVRWDENQRRVRMLPKEAGPRVQIAFGSPQAEINKFPLDLGDDPSAADVSSGPKPEWVDAGPKMDRSQGIYGTYEVTVRSKYQANLELCRAALDRELQATTREYLDKMLEKGAGQMLRVSPDFIHRNIVRDVYREKKSDFENIEGDMYQLHARLVFDDSVSTFFERQYRQAVVNSRLLLVGALVGAVLLTLGAVFGYLKIDTATRGYYSGRLKLATALVILMSAGLAVGAVSVYFDGPVPRAENVGAHVRLHHRDLAVP
jgi:hypothetical protein